MRCRVTIAGVIVAFLLLPALSAPTAHAAASRGRSAIRPAKGAAVRYTGRGFVPKAITVKRGTTVKFFNDTSSPLWVATDPHPVHTQLPGFEGKAPSKGASYSYAFTKGGTWTYHNHLKPNHTGAVKIER